MTRQSVTQDFRAEAARLGFTLCGVCPAVSAPGVDRFRQWLDAGYAGEMRYLPDRADAYQHPRFVLDGVRSIAMLAVSYRNRPPSLAPPGTGRISCYAWGPHDYHDVIHDRLRQLADFLVVREAGSVARGVVDTAPLLEREYAQLAGLGWIGKNTLLLNKEHGSWFFLAALLTSIELDYDQPHVADHCGTCRACLDACPTGAFPQAYVLDATRCISYLTIELRSAIPDGLRESVGDWLFGCDICQEVCPWNEHAPAGIDSSFDPLPGTDPIELTGLFDLDDEAFRRRFRHTPLWRSKRRGILRNAAIVLGNQRVDAADNALIRGLNDDEPLVRSASAWALGRLEAPASRNALHQRLSIEPDLEVGDEIRRALAARK